MQNLLLTSTGDYVIVNGRPVEDNSLSTPAFIRLNAQRQKAAPDGSRRGWMYAPDKNWGSDFDLYQQAKQTQAANPIAVQATAQRALKPLVDSGRAVSTTFATSSAGRGYSAFTTTIVQAGVSSPTQLVFDPLTN